MTLPELIAALERAEGPSQELDFRIWQFLNPEYMPARGWTGADHYTSSLDAALSLVPEGWDWCIACISGKWDAQVGEADTFMAEGAASNGSAAIALCIAALKARA